MSTEAPEVFQFYRSVPETLPDGRVRSKRVPISIGGASVEVIEGSPADILALKGKYKVGNLYAITTNYLGRLRSTSTVYLRAVTEGRLASEGELYNVAFSTTRTFPCRYDIKRDRIHHLFDNNDNTIYGYQNVRLFRWGDKSLQNVTVKAGGKLVYKAGALNNVRVEKGASLIVNKGYVGNVVLASGITMIRNSELTNVSLHGQNSIISLTNSELSRSVVRQSKLVLRDSIANNLKLSASRTFLKESVNVSHLVSVQSTTRLEKSESKIKDVVLTRAVLVNTTNSQPVTAVHITNSKLFNKGELSLNNVTLLNNSDIRFADKNSRLVNTSFTSTTFVSKGSETLIKNLDSSNSYLRVTESKLKLDTRTALSNTNINIRSSSLDSKNLDISANSTLRLENSQIKSRVFSVGANSIFWAKGSDAVIARFSISNNSYCKIISKNVVIKGSTLLGRGRYIERTVQDNSALLRTTIIDKVVVK